MAPGRACYVPLRHEVLDPQIKLAEAVEILSPLLADDCVLKVLHNAKFDMMVLERAGFPRIAPVDDTMLISYVLEGGLHGHGMDELSELHLGHKTIKFDTFDYGILKKRIMEDTDENHPFWTMGHPIVFPNILKTTGFQYRVPVDDENT